MLAYSITIGIFVYTLYILYTMRKLIDIPDELIIDLKVLAAKANLSLKAFIETLIIKKVESEAKANK